MALTPEPCHTPGTFANIAAADCASATPTVAPWHCDPATSGAACNATTGTTLPVVNWTDPRLDHPGFDAGYLVVAVLFAICYWALRTGRAENWWQRVTTRGDARQSDTETDESPPLEEKPQVNRPTTPPVGAMSGPGEAHIGAMSGPLSGPVGDIVGAQRVNMSAEEFDRRAAHMHTLRWGPATEPEPVSNFVSLDVPQEYTDKEARVRWMIQRLNDNWTPARIYEQGEIVHNVTRRQLERDLKIARARNAAGWRP